jgi:hypothetical protein
MQLCALAFLLCLQRYAMPKEFVEGYLRQRNNNGRSVWLRHHGKSRVQQRDKQAKRTAETLKSPRPAKAPKKQAKTSAVDPSAAGKPSAAGAARKPAAAASSSSSSSAGSASPASSGASTPASKESKADFTGSVRCSGRPNSALVCMQRGRRC